MAQLAAQEDPTRLSSSASNNGGYAWNWYSYVSGQNVYYGWYGGPSSGFGPWADSEHASYPTNFIGITEYGGGASIYQHSEDPVAQPVTTSNYHPEEYQNLLHESHWQQIKTRPYLWGTFMWVMFDFASSTRNEGDTPGRNDKGLVTYDRQVRKDAFYFYKANWTTNPMVYITGHTFTNRFTNTITAKIYANCDTVQLFLNGISQGVLTNIAGVVTNGIFLWPITLAPGSNSVQAVGNKGATRVSDSLFWLRPLPPPSASLTTPVGSTVYLNSTNDSLWLSASVSSAGPLTTTWTALSGPGTVIFGSSNAIATSASFSANGIYNLQFTANNGGVTNIGITVVVNPTINGPTNGLLAWWKMDQTNGTVALDSSGNNRNANIHGPVFTTGYLSNALSFSGGSDYANFSSPDTAQITVAAWVQAAGQGNSVYPRILDTPGYRFFFRFDSQANNGFDFATYHSTQNGDWSSGANAISTGTWFHVAASYDRSSLTNVPSLYVNGTKVTPIAVSSPSGTLPSYTGTGYIGNSSSGTRGWEGQIDDLRIYNRLLSDAEVQQLSSLPPANFNLAPMATVSGDQTLFLPASASLLATVSDDGRPNPPGVVTTTWSEFGGPGNVSFGNSNAPNTRASFSAAGSYQLQFVANDSQVSVTKGLTVTAALKPVIAFQTISNTMQLSWPANGGNWMLQMQTNAPTSGLGTNWVNILGATNPFLAPIVGTETAFYRLILTNF